MHAIRQAFFRYERLHMEKLTDPPAQDDLHYLAAVAAYMTKDQCPVRSLQDDRWLRQVSSR